MEGLPLEPHHNQDETDGKRVMLITNNDDDDDVSLSCNCVFGALITPHFNLC